ncbi:hypothetical protein J3R82DRAFT_1167 [Butyriboletus roseoflavus]|nr:hypothetical protein J3R82DRAFT_1167 [Butyriboletus roseoflavus]
MLRAKGSSSFWRHPSKFYTLVVQTVYSTLFQLIVSGDFFQLPPVPEQDSTSRIDATFTFQAQSWQRCIDHMVKLTKVFRQRDDSTLSLFNNHFY